MRRFIKVFRRKWASISFARKINIRLNEPIVSFTFDDAPISAFENGVNILSKFGFGGTFYISLSLMNGVEQETRFTVQHLNNAIAHHNEIGCHTYGHTDLYTLPFEKGKGDIIQNQEEMDKKVPGYTFRNFSYPFGSQTRAIKQFVSSKFRSARGIEEGINLNGADLYNLKTVKVYEHRFSPEYLHRKIDEVISNKGWLIFYTHDVMENPTDWGCSPGFFEDVVQYCANHNIKVLTVNDALNQIEGNS
ncbi:MAG: polysaccharide deacetylase family protein [Lewinellaceae bacterium]|jgi:peptidoglycan/xylan/chitin deacetylase (PgdA/CDA1 family)|nr:polysaccharide deacetylase family protein [Lewinellaceae bacterium]